MSQSVFVRSVFKAVLNNRRCTTEDFRRKQASSLATLLQQAKSVPFHARRLASFAPSRCAFDQLKQIDPVDKAGMMADVDSTFADSSLKMEEIVAATENSSGLPVYQNRILLSRTSGTNGDGGLFINDLTSWARQRGFVLGRGIREKFVPRELMRFSYGRRYRMAFLVSSCRHSVSTQSAITPVRLGKLFANIRMIPFEQSLSKLATELNEFQPHFLHCYPTVLHELISGAVADNISINPEIISCGSEMLYQHVADDLRVRFPKAKITSQYGTTECIPLANHCQFGRMHQNMDCCVVEPVRYDGTPTDIGELSDHVLITNLLNPVQPIIRYRLDDSIRLLDEPCECGSALPVIDVQGRSSDLLKLTDNDRKQTSLNPLLLVGTLVDCPSLMQWQVVQESAQALTFRFTARNGRFQQAKTEAEQQLNRILKLKACDQSVAVSYEEVSAFERVGEGQKFRQFVAATAAAKAA